VKLLYPQNSPQSTRRPQRHKKTENKLGTQINADDKNQHG